MHWFPRDVRLARWLGCAGFEIESYPSPMYPLPIEVLAYLTTEQTRCYLPARAASARCYADQRFLPKPARHIAGSLKRSYCKPKTLKNKWFMNVFGDGTP